MEAQSKGRDLAELVVSYGLILLVLWTPRPAQRWLYFLTLAWIVFTTIRSFPGWRPLGFCFAGLLRSLWVVGAAALVAAGAAMVASRLHTLHSPSGLAQWIKIFLGYVVWSLVQQYLLQGYFLLRLVRLLPRPGLAAIAAAVIFAVAHLPNPILTPVTLLWGLVACLVFLRFRNIYPLAVAHAMLGICIAVTIPAPVSHHMRVGLGYLTYRAPHLAYLSQSDHTVSTVAWVMAEAPTRRWARQALP